MGTLVFLSAAFLPPIISGPLPAMLLLRIAPGANWRRWLPGVGLLAASLNLIAFTIMMFTLDDLSGTLACGLTPIAAVVTWLVSRRAARRAAAEPNANAMPAQWLQLSLAVISFLPVLTSATLILFAPALCSAGIRACTQS